MQKRLGHSSATTTLDRCGWLSPSAEAALGDALDATYDADAPAPAPAPAPQANVIPLDPPAAEAV